MMISRFTEKQKMAAVKKIEKGMSQKVVAATLGVDVRTVKRWRVTYGNGANLQGTPRTL